MARFIGRAVVLLLLTVSPAGAQVGEDEPRPTGPTGRYHTLGVGFGETALVSYRRATNWRGRGLDIGLGIPPAALAYGGLVVVPHMGPTLWFGGDSAGPFVKGGIGAAVAFGDELAAAPIFYLGVGLLLRGPAGDGVRIEWTSYRWSRHEGTSALELGFVWPLGGRP